MADSITHQAESEVNTACPKYIDEASEITEAVAKLIPALLKCFKVTINSVLQIALSVMGKPILCVHPKVCTRKL